jgi:hypothetical protein
MKIAESNTEYLVAICNKIKTSGSFVIARRSEPIRDEVVESFEINSRRSNLPSLINPREVLNGYEITSFQTQSKEIASGMQQRLAKFIFASPFTMPRNGYAMKRSYEGWCGGSCVANEINGFSISQRF